MSRGTALFAVASLAALHVCAGGFLETKASGWGPEPTVQHSGYIQVNKTSKTVPGHIFFWLFESRAEPSKDPLVLWMT